MSFFTTRFAHLSYLLEFTVRMLFAELLTTVFEVRGQTRALDDGLRDEQEIEPFRGKRSRTIAVLGGDPIAKIQRCRMHR